MTTWTNITDASLEPGKPVRSIDLLALRDNAIAITEGAAGAPKIETASMTANSINGDRLSNGTTGAEKLQSGTTERDWVLGRNAGAAAGAVGSYAMALSTGATFGDSLAASSLRPSNADGTIFNAAPSGTWRCMGMAGVGSGANIVTIFLRIS